MHLFSMRIRPRCRGMSTPGGGVLHDGNGRQLHVRQQHVPNVCLRARGRMRPKIAERAVSTSTSTCAASPRISSLIRPAHLRLRTTCSSKNSLIVIYVTRHIGSGSPRRRFRKDTRSRSGKVQVILPSQDAHRGFEPIG